MYFYFVELMCAYYSLPATTSLEASKGTWKGRGVVFEVHPFQFSILVLKRKKNCKGWGNFFLGQISLDLPSPPKKL